MERVCWSVEQVTAGSEPQRSIFTQEICSAPSVPCVLPARPGPAPRGPRLPQAQGMDLGTNISVLGHKTPITRAPTPPSVGGQGVMIP